MVLVVNGVVGVMVSTFPLTESWLEENGITKLVLLVSSQIVTLPKLPSTTGSSKVIEIELGGLTVEPSAGEVAVATGAAVSMLNKIGAELGLVLPAGSVWVAIIECEPSASGVVGV